MLSLQTLAYVLVCGSSGGLIFRSFWSGWFIWYSWGSMWPLMVGRKVFPRLGHLAPIEWGKEPPVHGDEKAFWTRPFVVGSP